MKKIAALIMIIGITIISYACYKIAYANIQQKDSLNEAHDIINSRQTPLNTEQEPVTEAITPPIGETVGILEIPKIDSELPIIEGTDEDELAKGVGHYRDTVFPSENDQILLSGHRDTVFRRMGELEIGDIFTVKMPYGNFSYKIYETRIVSADDTTVIQSTAPDEILTVSTCYPFNYIGNAPDRFVINAVPVSSK